MTRPGIEPRSPMALAKISKYILKINFLNKPELIFFAFSVKWFQLFLSNMNNSIYY